MKDYYADKGMTMKNDYGKVALLKTDAGNLQLSVEEKAKQLHIGMSGYYIDESKNRIQVCSI